MKRLACSATLLACALLVTACGGGDDDEPQAQLSGVAATGAAIKGATVTVVNADGDEATATTDANGNYSIEIDQAAPYLLSVKDATGKVWYSFAPGAGKAHITPLTTLALLAANGSKPLDKLLADWDDRQLSQDEVLKAAAKVNAHFKTLMEQKGVAYAAFNVFNSNFAANGQGLDAVLDAMRVSFNCSATSCTQAIQTPNGETLVTWNNDISTAGISVSWTLGGGSGSINVGVGSCKAPKPGTYSMVVQTTVAGVGGLPEICVDGLPSKPATASEFCNTGAVNAQLPAGSQVTSCSYADPVGTMGVRVSIPPQTLDYTMKYTFVLR